MPDQPNVKHIVIDARQWSTTTGRYTFRLVQYLQKIDQTNRYTLLMVQKDFDSWKADNPNFQAVVTPYKEFTFGEQWGFKRQIELLKPDLVHFAMVQQPLLYVGKRVTTMHDLTTARFNNPSKNPVVFAVKQQVYKFVNWYVPRRNQQIIVPTEFVKKDVAAFSNWPADRFSVTYESADPIPDVPQPVPGIEDATPFIMYVGRPLPHKNLERLMQAFRQLQADHPDLKLVLVGKKDALSERLDNLAKQQGWHNIIFTDFVSEGQLRWLYEHTQAYIFPSLSEGFGLPGLEAMIHGAPVVSSNATCLPEVYGEAAHYFDPTNVNDMAHKIGQVLSDQTLRQKLIQLGKVQAGKYSWQRMAEQTLAVYTEALTRQA